MPRMLYDSIVCVIFDLLKASAKAVRCNQLKPCTTCVKCMLYSSPPSFKHWTVQAKDKHTDQHRLSGPQCMLCSNQSFRDGLLFCRCGRC